MSLRAWLQALALVVAVGGLAPAHAAADGPNWASLTPAQKEVLAPLQRDWASIEADRRQKWLEVAARYPQMSAGERERLQARMSDWARMSPAERATARQRFQEVRRVSDEERQARWKAYQALTPEERERLAQGARPAERAKAAQGEALSQRQAEAAHERDRADGSGTVPKRNIVRAPPHTAPRVVNPGVQQAAPGATTTPLTARSAPPLHNQTGLPKIVATPNFVDPQTLLPQKGPQGAAVSSAAPASEAAKTKSKSKQP